MVSVIAKAKPEAIQTPKQSPGLLIPSQGRVNPLIPKTKDVFATGEAIPRIALGSGWRQASPTNDGRLRNVK
jgi:hypothetical protein